MNMKPEIIVKFLNQFISPKWDVILEYEVSFSTHDDTGEISLIVDVIFDIKEYWKGYQSKEYNSVGEMDSAIESEIRRMLRYLNIDKLYIEIYVIDNDVSESVK